MSVPTRPDRRPARPRAPRLFLLAALSVAAAGLACVSQERLSPRRYVPVVERPGEPAAGAPGAGVLRLERPRVSSLFERAAFVVRTGETTWEEDHHHGFFAAPAVLWREALAGWLGDAGLYEQVVGEDHRGLDDHVLDVRVTALYLDLRDRADPRAVVEAEWRLYESEAIRKVERLRGASKLSESATGDQVEALLDAWSRAWAEVCARIEADLREAGGTPPST